MNQSKSQKAWSMIAFVFSTFPLAFSEGIQSLVAPWLFKGVLGISLGIVLASSHSTFGSLVYALRMNGLAAFDDRKASAVLHVFALLMFSLLGLILWAVNWESRETGIVYAIGIFIGGAIVRQGLTPLIESRYKFQIPISVKNYGPGGLQRDL